MTTIGLGSAGLNVTDLDRSIAFYRRALGFDLIRTSTDETHRFAHLGLDDVVLLTLWQQGAAGFVADRAGLHHLSFEVPSLDELHAVEARLRAASVSIREERGATKGTAATGQVFFKDPDGIRLEIYTEDPRARGSASDLPRCGFYEELPDR
ncbi:VOC family protein [Streptomyces sp. NPDC088812]|uniref:VOC family protein n=1 Tax=Streptomyces sp. NPDC088812 TaxID=3365905 RepID=UPI003824C81B